MNAQLARLMIQRQRRGESPPPTITAPYTVERRALTLLSESERLATFEQSARTVLGRAADYRKPQA